MSIGLAGVMNTVLQMTLSSVDPLIVDQASLIAGAYMEEIMSKPFLDPVTGTTCPAAPDNRIDFDNICDYQGFFGSASITDINGNTISELSEYTVSADITEDTGWPTAGAQYFTVSVTVYHSQIPDINIVAYKAYPLNE
jgi:MSHA pilin protein MshD